MSSKKQDDSAKNTVYNTSQNPFEIVISSEHPLFQLYHFVNPNDTCKFFSLNMSPDKRCRQFLTDESAETERNALDKALNLATTRKLRQVFSENISKASVHSDESAFVYISSDKMVAWILLFPAIGDGKPLNGSKLLQILIDRGVTFGVDYDLLYSLPKNDKRHFRLHSIAYGRPPVNGENGRIIELYSRQIEMNSEHCELSHVDYARLKLSRKIQKGGVICEIVPPTQGISGITVTRDLLYPAPEDGKPAVIPAGRNTCVSKNGRYLIAEKAGNVGYSGNNFQVKPVLEIFNGIVSKDDRNINFLGDVHIHGDVCPGAVIRAMGDVQIDGVVEAANIEAGENVIVSDGVLGQHSSVIRAHKGIYARFLEHCDVYSQDNVQADCIVDCNVYSNGSIITRTGMGAIIGGTMRCSKEISAKIVGSKSESNTTIILGGLPCDDAEREHILSELKEVNEEINLIAQNASFPESESALAKLRLNQYVAKMKLDKSYKYSESYHKQIAENDERIIRCEKIYPGTSITIGRSTLPIKETMSNCVIGMQDTGRVGCIKDKEVIS